MQKKVFLSGNIQKAKKRPGYVKLVLYAALALVLFVVIAPHVMRKAEKEVEKMPTPSKGLVVKEIPRTASVPPQGESSQVTKPQGGIVVDSEPNAPRFPEPKGLTELAAKEKSDQLPAGHPTAAPLAGPAEKAQETEQTKTQPHGGAPSNQVANVVKDREEAFRSGGSETPSQPKQVAPSGSVEVRNRQSGDVKVEENESATAGVVTPKNSNASGENGASATKVASVPPSKVEKQPAVGKQLFIVQVGSFKEKGNAEELKADLQKKGYGVVVKPHMNAKLGLLYVVQLAPVSEIGKANTLLTQIRHESNVNAFVIKVPATH